MPAVVVAAEMTWPPKTPSPPLERSGSLKGAETDEEAVERKPFKKLMTVVVPCELSACFVNGHAIPNDPAGQEVMQISVVKQSLSKVPPDQALVEVPSS